MNKFTYPDLPAILLQTSTVAKTKDYWFSRWGPVEFNSYISMLHIIQNKEFVLGEPSKKKTEKVGLLDQQGGGGLTESQLFVKFFQNQICLGTVHKCDETHTTQMGRQYLINS